MTPNRVYALSDIESISLSNGNVNLSIPLAALPPIAGGKLSWTISAQYNSKAWDVIRSQQNGDSVSWLPYSVDLPQSAGGWIIGGRYSIQFRNANEDFSRLTYPGNSGLPNQELQLLNNNQWRKAVLFSPDGSQHELRPTDVSPYPGTQDFLRGFYNVIPSGAAMRYYSVDGSYLFARISSALDWTIFLPDGTRVIQTPDGVQRLQDTNGNSIKIFDDSNGAHFQDEQTGREIRITYDPAANNGMGQTRVWYATVGGLEQHIDLNHGLTHVRGKLYRINDWLPSGSESGGGGAVCQRFDELNLDLYIVREIVFPQTEPGPARKFTFSYNSDDESQSTDQVQWSCSSAWENYTRTVSKGWGELSRMVTPADATVDYSYTLDSIHSLAGFSTDEISHQSISEKKTTTDGDTVDRWLYSISDTVSQVTEPGGNTSAEVKYCSLPNTPGCATDKSGLVYRSVGPFTKIERHWTKLQFSGANIEAPGGVLAFNAVVDKEYTSLTDSQGTPLKMSAKAYVFDFNGNITQTTEYDWFDPALVSRDAQGVPTGIPASATVLRVVNNNHYNQASNSSSANIYANRSVATGAPLILNAPRETTLGSSIVQFSYDGQAYDVPPTAGNLTTKKVWDDLNARWITTGSTYNLYGNLITATDGRGKVTQFFYEDATHALPTRVVVDPQNGSGTQSSTTVYDTSTGLVTSQTDSNGQVSTVNYVNQLLGTIDPFGRPGFTESPQVNIGGTNQKRRVTMTYLDSARQVIVETDLNAQNDKLLKTRTTSDMLGRPVLSEQSEDGNSYTISVKNAYLDMGRVTLTSTAMRSTASSTDGWTRVTRDAAGRVIEVASFGGATQPAWTGTSGVFNGAVTTGYSANLTTVTDQAGKVRRSKVDALGHLIRVDEPDDSGNLDAGGGPVQSTNYAFDLLGNLTTVAQGSQTRTFTYDSLSRLRSAENRENGTVRYQYDDNDNLLVKTDAREVSTHFEYDALNRVTRRWYNGSNSIGSTVHNNPALPTGVGATDELKFYYDSQLPTGAPSYSPGAAVGRLVAQTYGSGTNGDYYAYSALGQPTLKIQQIGTVNYQLSATYSLSGALSTLNYPSQRTVTNAYDQAGRLTSFGGNLGDDTARTYASGVLYSPTGGLVKEQFGTATPVYNKLFYNSRGQLAEIRASTSYTGPTDYDANRGALINSYSDQCTGLCLGASMPDNNGNLKRQDIQIPNQPARQQQYTYDSLNRLFSARELLNGTEQWKQQFIFDRWGNRRINTDPNKTSGIGINNKDFTVDPVTNHLGVPSNQSGMMIYDAAGNLKTDTYTGIGDRIYDAENKITSAWGGANQAQLYAYDASGQRVKRTVDGVQTWQVYGFSGELIAEYAASGAPGNPKKEYGYRNGQLLVVAEAGATPPTNVALAANGATVSASSSYSGFAASGAINGDRKGLFVWQNGYWSTASTGAAWLDVQFNGSKTISEIDLFTLQDNYNASVEPTEAMTFSSYGLTGFEIQYWTGSAWSSISGSITSNNKVWRKFMFAPLTTSKIKVLANASPDGYSRLAEVEAWTGPSPAPRYDLALGATATASSSWSSAWPPGSVTNGDRKSLNAGNGGAWVDAGPANTFPDWVQVDFGSAKTFGEIDVFTLQDNYSGSTEPTESMIFTQWGLSGYQVQFWDGGNWITVSGGSVLSNNKIWRKFTFSPITTSKIRVLANVSSDGYSRLTEIEAYAPPAANSGAVVRWLIADQLGTPRMVLDQSGSLGGMQRHDYLPFGEELTEPTGGRTPAQGYAGGEGVRQQFTGKERDNETGLDYFEARYYSSIQGRFTRPDPYNVILEMQATAEMNKEKAGSDFLNYLNQPQNWNRFTYVTNNPLKYVDPTGEELWLTGTEEERKQALERIKNLVGKDAAKYLTTTEYYDKGELVTVVSYSNQAFCKYEPDVTTRIADIIDSKSVLEYRIATTFRDRGGLHATADFGGAATVGREESLNGHTQIFVHPKGADIVQSILGVPSLLAASRSTNGKPLDFFDDVVDFHEVGHAYANMFDNVTVNSDRSTKRSLDFENVIRQRRGLSNRRKIH